MKRNAYLTTKQRSRGISWSFFGCQHGRARRPGSDNAHCVTVVGLDVAGLTAIWPRNAADLLRQPASGGRRPGSAHVCRRGLPCHPGLGGERRDSRGEGTVSGVIVLPGHEHEFARSPRLRVVLTESTTSTALFMLWYTLCQAG